jgi:hypothetical protein
MWDSIALADIDRAKQEIELRRVETLRRHAAEIDELQADDASIETLNRLAGAFCDKFKRAVIAPSAPNAAIAETAAASGASSPPPSRRPDRRDHARTNFDVFSRAMAKSTF